MRRSAIQNPAIEIDEDYWEPSYEKNMTLEVPYYLKQTRDDWLPCCFGGFDSMNYIDKKPFKSATGVLTAPASEHKPGSFPRIY